MKRRKWSVLFQKEICELYLSTDYAQVFDTAVNENVTYFVVRGIRVNPFSCVIQHFQCSAMSAIAPSPIRKSEDQTVQYVCVSAKPDFVMIFNAILLTITP